VDTESNSLHAYKERVCTIQISNKRANYIFDPIRLGDMSALAPLFSDSRVEKIFHGSDYDVGLLKRDFGYTVEHIFDTMIAAQFLNHEHLGMADLVEEYFDFRPPKKFTKCDWAKRPLSLEQMVYLVQDTQYLIDLRGYLNDELKERDLLEEAEIEFARQEKRPPIVPAYSLQDVWSIKGARSLNDKELSILYELFMWRGKRASSIDMPPFKVMNNKVMLDLAQQMPRNREEMFKIKGITANVWHRSGQDLLNSIRRGSQRPASRIPPPNKKKGNNTRQPVHWNDQYLVDALKKWRNEKAEVLGIHHLAVLPGYALEEVARVKPSDESQLASIEGVGKKRARLYSENILAIIKKMN